MLLAWLAAVLLVCFVGLLLKLAWQEQQHQLHGIIPSVSRLPLIGGAWELRDFQPDNLHEKFAEYVQRYGRSFMAPCMGHLMLVTAEPCYVDALLLSHQQLRKNIVYNALSSWLGNGLLISKGAHWHAMRKIITPTFHFSILEQFVEVFDRQCNVLVNKLLPSANGAEIVNIYSYMDLAALDIISETAMGVSVNAQLNADSEVVHAVKDVTNILATRFMRPFLLPNWLFRLCWPAGYRKQQAGVQCLHSFTNSIIERRRQLLQQAADDKQAPTGKRAALLDTLLQATLHGAPLTDAHIRDEVNTFIFEGHDTTTSAASFCLYLLSRHADIQQRLFDELRAHYGVDKERAVVHSDFTALNYLHCVVKESLRLYPPVPAVGRCLEKDLVVGNARIPAGANVIVLLWQLLRDEAIYEQPLRFWPERHLADDAKDLIVSASNAYSYIPFSAGPRNCIGQRFALYEVKTIVIKMLRHFKLLPLGPAVQPSIKIVLRSSNGVNFGLTLRSYTQL